MLVFAEALVSCFFALLLEIVDFWISIDAGSVLAESLKFEF